MAWEDRSKRPTVGEWIRNYLIRVGEDYVYSMWTEYKEDMQGRRLKPASYDTFRRYIHMLKTLDLVRNVFRETGTFGKSYYSITPGSEHDPRWRNFQKALYGEK